MKNFGCLMVLLITAAYFSPPVLMVLGAAFKIVHNIWNSGSAGPLLVIGVPVVLLLLAMLVGVPGNYGLSNPAKYRYYHMWTEENGVSVPMKFAEIKQYPPETLVCMMHGGVTDPGAWHPLQDFTERGIPRQGAPGRPHLPHPDLWSTFTAGPMPPDFSK